MVFKGEKLPYRVLKTASKLFCTAMSHNDILNFFCYELNMRPEEVTPPEAKNKNEAFEAWLSRFQLAKQKELILRLCQESIPMYYGMPPEAERIALAKSLQNCVVETTVEKTIVNLDTVKEYWTKSLERINNDPEGAITTARTLLETVFKHILEECGMEKEASETDIQKLYSHCAKSLNLSPSQHTENEFKQILGGCHSVVMGLGAIRNKISDAHGKGHKRIKPSPRHAELAVNLAGAMASFLISTLEFKKTK